MDPLKRQALYNAAVLVAKLEEGQTITRDQLIAELRKSLPPVRDCPSDAVILHAYRYHVLNAGLKNGYRTVTYEEAAALADKSVEAIRQAAYRGTLRKSTEYWNGRERTGVYIESLADWCKWTPQERREADRGLQALREDHDPREPTNEPALAKYSQG